jgi:uncharacterized protein (DUF433 family)
VEAGAVRRFREAAVSPISRRRARCSEVTDMGALKRVPAIKAEVVSDPTVMSGDPVVKGTRILAETILSYLRADCSPRAIFEDYPSLPVDGIDAVARWAEQTYGADWRSIARDAAPPAISG